MVQLTARFGGWSLEDISAPSKLLTHWKQTLMNMKILPRASIYRWNSPLIYSLIFFFLCDQACGWDDPGDVIHLNFQRKLQKVYLWLTCAWGWPCLSMYSVLMMLCPWDAVVRLFFPDSLFWVVVFFSSPEECKKMVMYFTKTDQPGHFSNKDSQWLSANRMFLCFA